MNAFGQLLLLPSDLTSPDIAAAAAALAAEIPESRIQLDIIAPVLLRCQSVVLLVRISVAGALRRLIDPNAADTTIGRPELFRFDRELWPIPFRP